MTDTTATNKVEVENQAGQPDYIGCVEMTTDQGETPR